MTARSAALLGLVFLGLPARTEKPSREGPLKDNASWAVLRKATESRDYSVRLLVVQALGSVRSADVTPWLEHALGDPEHDVRVAAIDSLRRIGSKRALALLRTVRDDESEALDVRALAASVLLDRPAD
jgi:HEAT repeat protein